MKALAEMNNTEKAHLLSKLFPGVLEELTQIILKEKRKKWLAKITTKKVDKALDKLFINLHRKTGTINGDITPDQEHLLEAIKIQLISLIVEQIFQNLPQDI